MPPSSTATDYSARLHRRPAYAVNSPAILCHRCYSFNREGAPANTDASTQSRLSRILALNQILRAVQTATPVAGKRPRIQVFEVPKDESKPQAGAAGAVQEEMVGPQETILATLPILDQRLDEWSGWRARIRIDLHIEYYSVTFILDRRNLKTTLKRTPEAPPSQPAGSRDYVSEWYRKKWDKFFEHFAEKGIALNFPADEQFFECRGLVLDTAPLPSAASATADSDTAPTTSAAEPEQNSAPYRILDERIFKTRRKDARGALQGWIDRNGNLMNRILRLDRSEGDDQDANCVLCFVMAGRGVYGSSMGRSEAELRAASKRPSGVIPERYLLLHHGVPRFQVGRLLRRFHVLDELRCASTFRFKELIDASKNIRSLGDKIDNDLRNNDKGLTQESLVAIQNDLNALTSKPDIGGLLYRINRSRFYTRNFKLGMEDLLFAPIKGWEPYDAFMHRSLFPTMDHIDNIGQRYDALAARVERLTEERDTKELINVQNGLVRVQTRIADIQEIGEIIGWTAAAYYAGQIFGKLIRPFQDQCKPGGAVAGSDFCSIIAPIGYELAGLMISCPLAFILYKKYKRQREARSAAEG